VPLYDFSFRQDVDDNLQLTFLSATYNPYRAGCYYTTIRFDILIQLLAFLSILSTHDAYIITEDRRLIYSGGSSL